MHVNYGKTDSLCLLLLHPSQPYPPLIAYSSPPSKYWQREAHGAQRGLGDVLAVTHDATINTKASFRRTGHFEADLELLATFDSQTTFFHPRVFSVRFTPLFFPLHNISATDLNDLSFLLFLLEEQKRCKPLGGGKRTQLSSIFLQSTDREDDSAGQHNSGRKWGQRGRTGPEWDTQIPDGERQPARKQGRTILLLLFSSLPRKCFSLHASATLKRKLSRLKKLLLIRDLNGLNWDELPERRPHISSSFKWPITHW